MISLLKRSMLRRNVNNWGHDACVLADEVESDSVAIVWWWPALVTLLRDSADASSRLRPCIARSLFRSVWSAATRAPNWTYVVTHSDRGGLDSPSAKYRILSPSFVVAGCAPIRIVRRLVVRFRPKSSAFGSSRHLTASVVGMRMR